MLKIKGINLILLFTVSATLFSCSKEEVEVPTCINGDCDAMLSLNGLLDSNGYYHVDLDWSGKFYPRFNISVDADLTDPWFWYNGSPAIQANFYTDTTWRFNNDILPVVQGARINLRKYSDTKAEGIRIVGPIPPQMEGDTIEIQSRIWWEAGVSTQYKDFSLKIIVE